MISIRTKLLCGLLIPLIIVAAFVSLETFFTSKRISRDLNDKTLLAASLTILERVISTNGNLLAEETLSSLTENLGDRFFYHVSGPNGAFVTGYSGYPRPPVDLAILQDEPVYYDGIHLGKSVRVVLLKRDFSERELSGITAITTWQHITQQDKLTYSLFTRSILRLLLLVSAAGMIVWFALRFGLNPLIKLQAAIDRRTPYDLTPIKRIMPIELSGIVRSMNELFERVARSKRNRERFIGDAAHQLRNPIAAIKVQAETALEADYAEAMKASLQQIVAVTNSSSLMINKMLSSARAYAMERKSEQVFDLVKMINAAVLEIQPKAIDYHRDITFVSMEKTLFYQGSETLLHDAVINLIDNAMRYADPSTPIEVGLIQMHQEIEIFVTDSGPAFDEDKFRNFIQPFYTENNYKSGDDHQPGTGLGLAIVRDIAKSHGGYLAMVPLSRGKRISIILPL